MGLDIDGETLVSWVRQGYDTLGNNSEEATAVLSTVATGTNPVAGVLLGVAGTISAGLLQEKAVEAGARLDQWLEDLADELEDSEDAKRARVGAALQRFTGCLPDGEQWEESLVQSMNGDPSELVALLETYQHDDRRREQFGQTVEAVITGEVDAQLDEDEDFLDYLQTQFDAEDREDALATFLDVQDLLTAREVHESLETLYDIQVDIERIERDVRAGKEKLDALLGARLLNDDFQRLDDRHFRLPEESDIETAIQRGFRPADVATGLAVGRPVRFRDDDGDRTRSPAETAAHLASEEPGMDLLVRGRPASGKTTFCLSVMYEWFRADYGAVIHRDGGGQPIDDMGDIVSEIARAEGQVLVVIDDAVRSDDNIDLMRRYEEEHDGDDVTFLLNCRHGEFDLKK